MNKINIAFAPKNPQPFFDLANNYKEFHTYRLGPASLPHVTICQCYLENSLQEVWDKLSCELPKQKINLNFKTYSNISFDGDIFWLSLIPEEISRLNKIYSIVSKLVNSIHSHNYDPHLTLLNYFPKKELFLPEISISETFELVVGSCDRVGQLTEIIIGGSII